MTFNGMSKQQNCQYNSRTDCTIITLILFDYRENNLHYLYRLQVLTVLPSISYILTSSIHLLTLLCCYLLHLYID